MLDRWFRVETRRRPVWRCLGLVACLGIAAGGMAPPSQAKPESGDGVVRFVYVDAQAESVYLVGDFNGWSPTATPLDREPDGTWVALVFMDPGTYEYKFYVDGAWKLDPDNLDVSENGNSLVRVGATGRVLALPTPAPPGREGGAGRRQDLRWDLRYLGFFTWRRQPELRRWEFETPVHDVDLRLETDVGDDVTGWFLMNFNTREDALGSRTTLRYDRGVLLWRPREFEIRLFDNEGVTEFGDPGALVGKIGIYDDAFGYQRRGVHLRRRLFGAPLEFLYADDRDPDAAADSLDATLPVPAAAAGRYVSLDSRRDADTFAFRARAGSDASGLGFGYRMDRGAAPGVWSELQVQRDSLGFVGTGRQLATRENWSGWNVDLRGRRFGVHMVAAYMSGSRRAAVQQQRLLQEARFDSIRGTWSATFGADAGADGDLLLDESRRALLTLAAAETRRPWQPSLRYEYQENDFSAVVTGRPFLMRRHQVGFGLRGQPGGMQAQLQVEQSWFDYPEGSTWETQFSFRKHNFWLERTKAAYERFTWLGADRGSLLRLDLSRSLWAPRDLQAALRFTLASPGFDRPPRYLETVLRLRIDVVQDLALHTHSRFASFRRFETQDPDIVAVLGAGKHVQAGVLAQADVPGATYDYRTYGSHFVELVYSISERSDVSLGFGVDPYVLYEVRNTYQDIGWDQFLFDAGASPQAAFADPRGLGERIHRAEKALQLERRLMLEARIQF